MKKRRHELPSTRRKKSLAAKRRWADPEARRRLSETIRAKFPPKPVPPPTAACPPKPGVRAYVKHNLTLLLKTLKEGGLGAIDQRSALAKATARLRSEIVRDLGGEENLSAQQRAIVEEFIKRSVMVESIDAWIFTQPTVINQRTHSVYPIVLQRQTIADGMVRCLERLGLERRAKQVETLTDYIKEQGS